MKILIPSLALLLPLTAALLDAQTPGSPVANAFRQEAEGLARNLTAAADDMPAPKFVARLKRSFAFCHSAFATLDDTRLGEKVPWFDGAQATRAEGMFERVDDWADHYGQLANYLRQNGILPPTARPAKTRP